MKSARKETKEKLCSYHIHFVQEVYPIDFVSWMQYVIGSKITYREQYNPR
jgi:hypothetical protein